jgi:hypothetical protein
MPRMTKAQARRRAREAGMKCFRIQEFLAASMPFDSAKNKRLSKALDAAMDKIWYVADQLK